MGVVPPEQALELLDIGGIDKVYEDYLVDKRQADRENLKMSTIDPMVAVQLLQPPVDEMTGMPKTDPMTGEIAMPEPVLPPNSWDNHQAHIMMHNRFRKTQQFELLPLPIKQIFESHVVLHQMALIGSTPMMPGGIAGPPLMPGGTVMDQAGAMPSGQPNEQQAQGNNPPPPQG